MVLIACLFASAFTADPGAEVSVDCIVPVASETSQTLITFAMGFICCFIMKRRHGLAAQMCKMVDSAKRLLASVCSSSSSVVSTVAGWISKFADIIAMVVAGTLCAAVILGLFISAFTAVPEAEPTDYDIGLASESSQAMRAFTVGWMFLLSLKLRSELVGLVGSGCLLQPC